MALEVSRRGNQWKVDLLGHFYHEAFTVTEGGIDVVSAFTETWKQIKREGIKEERQRILCSLIKEGFSDTALLNTGLFSRKEIEKARMEVDLKPSIK